MLKDFNSRVYCWQVRAFFFFSFLAPPLDFFSFILLVNNLNVGIFTKLNYIHH